MCHSQPMQTVAPDRPQTNALAYGGVVSAVAVICGILLLPAQQAWAQTALLGVGGLLFLEGLGLVTNWRRGAEKIAALIQGRPPATGSMVAMHLGKTSFVRNTLGPTAIVLSVLFVFAAVRAAVS